MSKIIFSVSLLVVVVCVHGGPTSTERPAEIIKYEYVPLVNSGYRFAYETSDHQSKIEDGTINNGSLRVNGTYSYIDTIGGTHTIQYVSDKHGFSSQNLDVAAAVPNRVAKNAPAVDRTTAPIITTTATILQQPAAPTVIIP